MYIFLINHHVITVIIHIKSVNKSLVITTL